MARLSLRDNARPLPDSGCIRCGEGESEERGFLVYLDGYYIHYAGCLNRALRPTLLPKTEKATAAPDEVRDVQIPKKKRQPKRPQSLPLD